MSATDPAAAAPLAQEPPTPADPAAGTTPAPTPAEGATEPESGAGDGNQTGQAFDAAYVARLRQESAANRVRAKDAEAVRDRLAARLERTDRTAVEAAAAATMHSPEDLLLAGVSLDRLRNAEGELDDGKIAAELERVIAEHPRWRQGVPDFAGGARGPAQPAPSFGAALKRAVTGER